ncbi:MAG: thermopsin family protease [Thermoplasmataceae archaeon]
MFKSHGNLTPLFSAVVVIMVLSSVYVVPSHVVSSAISDASSEPSNLPANNSGSNSSIQNVSAESQFISTVSSIINTSGSSSRLLFLPNMNADAGISNGHVTPLYTGAPAPMGIGDFGIINGTGINYNTSSFSSTITINNMSAYYLLNDGPHSFSGQLNTVLTNVTIEGQTGYTYWTQNVFIYSTRTHTLSFENNIWNFTGASSIMQSGTISNSTGNVYPNSQVYIAIGPSFTVSEPFALTLYLNETNDPATHNNVVYFNYSITGNINGTQATVSNTYDRVTFNSDPRSGMPHSAAHFHVSGTELLPNGLLYDAEFMIGGPGGGSTTTIYAINAALTLKYLFGDHYTSVKSAYDFGTDTGETSSGISEYYTPNDLVYMNAGPSLLYGMWNTTNITSIESVGSGYSVFRGEMAPSNGFIFVSQGKTFNQTSAQWAPTTANGSFTLILPPGSYSAETLMSNHNPVVSTLKSSSTTNFAMTLNYATGIYTPLFASNNGQLANISYSGRGMEQSPYVLYGSNQTVSMNPLFAEMNDFTFPVFGGLMISNVSNYTVITPPAFKIEYPSMYFYILTVLGLPDVNYLTMQVYQSSNLTIENSSYVSGWFSSYTSGFPVANIVLWNSTGINVTGNYFLSEGSSLLIYNNDTTLSNNTVTGNFFAIDGTTTNAFEINYLNSNTPMGLQLYSSHNRIYNNFFSGTEPVYSPSGNGSNIYTGGAAIYTDNQWNVSPIRGRNIIGGSYISGNYWMSDVYGPGISFNDYGNIANGSDQSPIFYPQSLIFTTQYIPPATTFLVEFESTSLTPSGAPAILFGGVQVKPTIFSQTSSIEFYLPNGTYEYYANATGPYEPIYGNVTLNGGHLNINLPFYSTAIPEEFAVLFAEKGLPGGTKWSVTLNGHQYSSTNGTIEIPGQTPGMYNYTIDTVVGYVSSSGGSFQLGYNNTYIGITFVQTISPLLLAGYMILGLIAGALAASFVVYSKMKKK